MGVLWYSTRMVSDGISDYMPVGEDLIDDFYSGKMWSNGLPGGPVFVGRVQSEGRSALGQTPATKKNTYLVRTTEGHMIPDCILLQSGAHGSFTKTTQFQDNKLPGSYYKPYHGSLCIVVTASGGEAFIVGFFNPPTTTSPRNGDQDEISETNPGSLDDTDASVQGDYIVRTEDALLNIKRGGAIVIESGASIRQSMNPFDGCWFTQARKQIIVSEGFISKRGRVEKTKPQTLSSTEYMDVILQRGRKSTKVTVKNGKVVGSTVREVSVSEVDFAVPTSPVETVKFRERHDSDGSWLSEGPKYQWGGESADEPLVLGNKLVETIKDLSGIIRSMKVLTAWGPAGVAPTTVNSLMSLERGLDDILSDYLFITKEPSDPDAGTV